MPADSSAADVPPARPLATDTERLHDLACRLEKSEQRAKHLRRLLELGQSLTAEATKADWSRRVAGEVLRAARCRWAAYCVSGREVDRIFVQRRHARDPQVTIRPSGHLRRSAGDSWTGRLPCLTAGERFGLPEEPCWYLQVRVHERVRGALVLPQSCLGRQHCGDASELLALLGQQVSQAAELAELHGDVVHAATFDRMTGALNRGAWLERAEARLDALREHGGRAAVVLFDLDHFKEINDHLGHAAGDDYLIAVAHAARSVLRGEDLCARFGGDEFVVWLENLEPQTLASVIERLMVRVSSIATRVQKQLGDGVPSLGISVGVAVTEPDEARDIDQLLEAADGALYAAKAGGRGTWRAVHGGGQAQTG